MNTDKILFYSGRGNYALGVGYLKILSEVFGADLSFSHVNFNLFPDDESDTQIPHWENIAGKTIVLHGSINSDVLETEFKELAWAIKNQYGAQRVIAVIPFLRYRRQDHPEKMEEINCLRMIISSLKHRGVDDLITVTPHSDQMKKCCQEYGINFYPTDISRIAANAISPIITGSENGIRARPRISKPSL